MTEKPQMLMLTFRDPLYNAVQVKYFRSLYDLRKFIRSLCFNVPYKITINSDNEWRGSYHFVSDIFTEYHEKDEDRIEFSFNEVFDDKDIQNIRMLAFG